jgi:carboxyl-terminal processing protease
MDSKSLLRIFSLAFLVLVAVACDRDDPVHPNEHVNNWIYDNMKFWYYWTDEIPADPDRSLEHKAFFESLLSDKDRFSWIEENYQELLNSLQGVEKEPGYEFVLYREAEGSNNVIAQLLYVKPNSPASTAGLKRGDLITKINDQQLTVDNYQALAGALGSDHTISYRALDIGTKTFADPQSLSISPVVYAENPNFLNKVFTYNNRRIGYYVYNFFSNGTSAAPEQYKGEMDQIFSSFQTQGITDLIVDLRFNSGGAESAATNLASLVGRDVHTAKIFVKHEYNEEVTDAILKDPNLGDSFLTVYFYNKSQGVGGFLTNGRVYILTGSRTASASELIVNGLRPYMDVYLVGNKTVGKNQGSISIYDKDDPENTWGMQPIVTKLLNSLDQSNYDEGFTPQLPNADNSLYIHPLGDPKETLLNLALQQITGSPVVGRMRDDSGPTMGAPLGHSLDMKKRSGRVVIDPIR